MGETNPVIAGGERELTNVPTDEQTNADAENFGHFRPTRPRRITCICGIPGALTCDHILQCRFAKCHGNYRSQSKEPETPRAFRGALLLVAPIGAVTSAIFLHCYLANVASIGGPKVWGPWIHGALLSGRRFYWSNFWGPDFSVAL